MPNAQVPPFWYVLPGKSLRKIPKRSYDGIKFQRQNALEWDTTMDETHVINQNSCFVERFLFLRNLRPNQIYEDFDKTREDVTNIGLKECRIMAWCCYDLKYGRPHWNSPLQRINKFPCGSKNKNQRVTSRGDPLWYSICTCLSRT